MYHASTPQYKDVILRSIQQPDRVVRVVFATIALGMGIDLKGVNRINHYGAPKSLEDYFQESGRGGRQSGDSATSLVFWKPVDCPVKKEPSTPHDHEMIAVRRYLENRSECRRTILLEYFDPSIAKPGKEPFRCCDTVFEDGCCGTWESSPPLQIGSNNSVL